MTRIARIAAIAGPTDKIIIHIASFLKLNLSNFITTSRFICFRVALLNNVHHPLKYFLNRFAG